MKLKAICKVIMKNVLMLVAYFYPKMEEIENKKNIDRSSLIGEFCASILPPQSPKHCNIHIDLCESKIDGVVSKHNVVDYCHNAFEGFLEPELEYQLYAVEIETRKLKNLAFKMGMDIKQESLKFGLVVSMLNEKAKNFRAFVR